MKNRGRKANSQSRKRKRPRSPVEEEDSRYWSVVTLLDHRSNPKTHDQEFLVQWDRDPDTGEDWPPSWQPEHAVTKDLVEDYWKENKKKEAKSNDPESQNVAESKGPAKGKSTAKSKTNTRLTASNPRAILRRGLRSSKDSEQSVNRSQRQTSTPHTLSSSSSKPESQPGQAETVARPLSSAEASPLPSPAPDQNQAVVDSTPPGVRKFLARSGAIDSSGLSSPPDLEPDPEFDPKFDPELGPEPDSEPDHSEPDHPEPDYLEPDYSEVYPESEGSEYNPQSGSEYGSEASTDSKPEVRPKVKPKAKPKAKPASGPALEQAAELEAEPEGELEASPASEFELSTLAESEVSTLPGSDLSARQESIPETVPRTLRTRGRSYSNKVTELYAYTSHEFSGYSRASSFSFSRPSLQGSGRERRRGGEPDHKNEPRFSAEQTEEAHTEASAASSPRSSQRRVSTEPPTAASIFAEETGVESPRPSSIVQPLERRASSHDSLSEEGRTPAIEIARRNFNPTYRLPFLGKSFLVWIPIFDSHPLSEEMNLPTESVINPLAMEPSGSGIVCGGAAETSLYDNALGGSALPIQDSIEEEEHTSNGEQFSSESKASSSQQSVENERDVPQVAGLVQPSLPILGPAEYAISLPCEGKIQSTYSDIIKAKEKAIKKFLSRHESVGSSDGSPTRTQERNDMNELVQHLHDTVTHMDLGLPGMPTHYPGESQEYAAYANYAGSKFSFLGHLVDLLKSIGCSIIVMAREGPIQDLIENYLKTKQITVKRQDRLDRSKPAVPDRISTDFQVELVSTWSTHPVAIYNKPILMIAFDASFDSQDPQVARIRSHFSGRHPALMPVLHLLVANSSEHVDRCLPKSMPSPMRLKALIRATYQAWPNLGGKPIYLPRPTDEPEGRPMDSFDLQRGIRKSAERKLGKLASIVVQAAISPDFDANWNLGLMSELQLTELEETPTKRSGVNTRAETPKERLLDVDGFLPALQKRQRLTPLRDSAEANSRIDTTNQVAQHQDHVKKLVAEVEMEREARQKAEQDLHHSHGQLAQWKQDHAGVQRRYEKRRTMIRELKQQLEQQKETLQKTIETLTTENKKLREENLAQRQKNAELEKELAAARAEIKAGGGDAAAAEAAREELRTLRSKYAAQEKTLGNTRKDFEFTRIQYQDASEKAAEYARQIRGFEEQVAHLKKQASIERRHLKETNHQNSIKAHLAKIAEQELEHNSQEKLIRKLEEENRNLKRSRGYQTRGSSVQPPGSPGLDGHSGRGTRSRQGSPAPGLFANSHHNSVASRGSLLRHER
ncbi:hypothetical protein CLAIMM_02982 [Cladophialophora immunda]|nr:hypothetical protein CLAIMM_02982 [Cladophialophora immunda]